MGSNIAVSLASSSDVCCLLGACDIHHWFLATPGAASVGGCCQHWPDDDAVEDEEKEGLEIELDMELGQMWNMTYGLDVNNR